MNPYNFFADVYTVYALITKLFCTGIIIDSLEYLFSLSQYATSGLFSWKILKLRPELIKARFNTDKFDRVFSKKGIRIIILLRLCASSCLLITNTNQPGNKFLILIIAITSFLLTFHSMIGKDGSDQMNAVIFIPLLITFFSKNEKIAALGLCFICAQATLSYLVAGIAKLISPEWNNGMAVFKIMNTKTYGDKKIAEILQRLPAYYTKFLNWNIIVFECLFLLVIFLPWPWCLIFIFWGFLFHLYNAIMMGLNGFFWAFLASYPAIVYVNWQLHHL
jgi:hypothetical protein